MFDSVLNLTTGSMDIGSELICIAAALILGAAIAFVYGRISSGSRNFLVTLALLPVLVQVVIMLVNGNLGAGVAVAGAFSLVRFRSLPGTSREILGIFFSMVVGLACGMGYVSYAVLFTVIVCAVLVLLEKLHFGEKADSDRQLKITIPENLDYTGVFDDLFEKYTVKHELDSVKTTNMGSMYELRYSIALKDPAEEKHLIDELRCRNGNLTIACGKAPAVSESAMF